MHTKHGRSSVPTRELWLRQRHGNGFRWSFPSKPRWVFYEGKNFFQHILLSSSCVCENFPRFPLGRHLFCSPWKCGVYFAYILSFLFAREENFLSIGDAADTFPSFIESGRVGAHVVLYNGSWNCFYRAIFWACQFLADSDNSTHDLALGGRVQSFKFIVAHHRHICVDNDRLHRWRHRQLCIVCTQDR